MSANYNKFNKTTNWQPSKSFVEGLKITIDWYRNYLENFENKDSNFQKLF